jgi:hypothetical protein
MGLVPRARLLANLSAVSSWGVVKKAFRPGGRGEKEGEVRGRNSVQWRR